MLNISQKQNSPTRLSARVGRGFNSQVLSKNPIDFISLRIIIKKLYTVVGKSSVKTNTSNDFGPTHRSKCVPV